MSDAVQAAPQERPAPRPLALLLAALDRIGQLLVALLLVVVLVFTVGQVVDRYVLKGAFNAYDQMARLGLVWLTFIGIAMGFRERANIRIDLLDHLLPPRFAAVKGAVLDAAILALTVLIHVESWRLIEVGAFQVVIGTPFTYVAVYSGLVAGTALLAVFLALRLLAFALGGRAGDDAAAP
jgi:TRAP-type transport system small permease protein